MRKLLVRALALAAVASLAFSAVASATVAFRPWRFPVGTPDPWVQPAGTGWCDFDLYVDMTRNKVEFTVIAESNGGYRMQATGTQVITFTDLANHHTGTWQTPAFFIQEFDANDNLVRFYTRGPAITIGSLPPLQDGGVYQYKGSVDSLNATYVGTRIDICAALAAS